VHVSLGQGDAPRRLTRNAILCKIYARSANKGHGKKTHKNGDVYEGEWKHDKRHGVGKKTWHDGSWYDGGWRDGLRHGVGVKVEANGDKYEVRYHPRRIIRCLPCLTCVRVYVCACVGGVLACVQKYVLHGSKLQVRLL
jgi:hypothetical protein